MRPVKRVDAAGSIKLSQEFVGSLRTKDTSAPGSPTATDAGSGGNNLKKKRRMSSTSAHAKAGRLIVSEVVVPSLQKCIRDDMNAKEIEAVSMIQRGFEELRDANSDLAYDVLLDILTGLNE